MTIEAVYDIERELREYGDRPPPRRAWIDMADRLRAVCMEFEKKRETYLSSLVKCDSEIARLKAALKPVLECSIEKFIPGHETYAVEPFYTSATFGVEDAEGDAIQDESIATALNAVREAQRICEGGAK